MATSDVQWGKIRDEPRLSWHVFRTFTRVPGVALSLCNRRLDADTLADDRVAGEKTCELCLREAVE